MKKSCLFIISLLTSVIILSAQTREKEVTVSKNNTLEAQISPSEKTEITSLIIKGEMSTDDINYLKSLCSGDSSTITELYLPKMAEAPGGSALKSVRRIIYDDINYMPAHSFRDCGNIEEVVFGGIVGHIDGYVFINCPKLKNVSFEGPVFSTGGPQFTINCPELETINLDGIVYSTYFSNPADCPKFKGYNISGAVVWCDSEAFKATPKDKINITPEQLDRSLKWIETEGLNNSDSFLTGCAMRSLNRMKEVASATDRKDLVEKIDKIRLNKLRDGKDSYIDLLRASNDYWKSRG